MKVVRIDAEPNIVVTLTLTEAADLIAICNRATNRSVAGFFLKGNYQIQIVRITRMLVELAERLCKEGV